jgi:hypothetical protein
MVGSGAAPARMPRKHSSGRPRVAVRPYYGGLPSMAGRARTRGGESHPAREGEESSVQWPEERPRGQKSPQMSPDGASLSGWSAGRRDGPIARPMPRSQARNCYGAFRRSAPLVVGSKKRNDGVARAARHRAGGAMRHAEVRAQRASKHDAASFEARRSRGSHLRMTTRRGCLTS